VPDPAVPSRSRRACVLFADANVLLDHPDLGAWRCDRPDVRVLVLERVSRELEGLGRRGDATATRARRAWLALEAVRRAGPRSPRAGARVAVQVLRGSDASASVDQHLVAEAAAYGRRWPEVAVGVVTRDRGVWERAMSAGVACTLVRGSFDDAALAGAVRETLAAHDG
jgi:rRNA-processing protein FCF1